MTDKTKNIISLNSFKEKKITEETKPIDSSYKNSTYKPFRNHNGFYFPILNCMLLPGTPI